MCRSPAGMAPARSRRRRRCRGCRLRPERVEGRAECAQALVVTDEKPAGIRCLPHVKGCRRDPFLAPRLPAVGRAGEPHVGLECRCSRVVVAEIVIGDADVAVLVDADRRRERLGFVVGADAHWRRPGAATIGRTGERDLVALEVVEPSVLPDRIDLVVVQRARRRLSRG